MARPVLVAVLFALAAGAETINPLDMRWTFGAHEPITMYRRKGVRTTGGIEGSSKWVASWLDWFDTESPKLMKELGLNWCHCRFYKGMGWEFEKRDFPNVKRFVDAAHANGVGTLAYIQFMTLYYENMLAEIPNLRDWAARDHEGNMMYYYGGGYYRWVPCISCDEWIDYLVPIMRFAVTEGGFDGVMFDNAFSRHCHCERCQRKFREHLAKLPNAAERHGVFVQRRWRAEMGRGERLEPLAHLDRPEGWMGMSAECREVVRAPIPEFASGLLGRSRHADRRAIEDGLLPRRT